MAGKLASKIALVTGAAQGIGAAAAIRMAAEGAMVFVADIHEGGARDIVEKITDAGGQAAFVALDVTQEDAWAKAIDEVRSTHGALHVLINNAGIGLASPLTETDYATWRKIFAINVDGMFLGMKHAMPLIKQSGGGSVINLSSAAAMKPYENMAAYCGTKAAIAQITKVAAMEGAKDGIRVNSLHPGMIATPAWDRLGNLKGGDFADKLDLDAMAKETVPLGYVGVPDDIANAVIYLASDDGRYMTGHQMVVDGGQTLL
ncbi:NAD(P)-dependent dehydrogenase (short-subunit alcohol dehydrogenase family) [Pseudomonas duriflava]|uniref:NAD(P)-dependent dehydrogenase (Short-subunit alcohol dehydrogenase family) n=1 Tax=Pseudomonas duriflava TaxID=459528 RepID=A0A562PMK4_9PSED|nr:glucose 1-dehydrogenase [Pseudomonas duriflava]TWI45649.1 NAD(P)-dependent dehydrogenase (short-subunit alcohol dehydrogenase family) [Pseudomonas duriflava]